MTQILLIKDLYVDVGNTSIVNGLNLEIKSGETHAIMGPNGSGKSTLAKTIAGHPDYKIRSGVITYMDQNLNDLSIEERSNLGIFLGFQYPIEIPGLSNTAFLKAAINAKRKYNDLDELSASDFLIDLKEKSRMVDIEQSFLSRGVNEGFSGGEKKRNEILQMLMLEPVLSILDETDSGLDIDSMKVVASGVNAFRNDDTASLIITHYERLLNYITPDYVHVFHNGAIIKTGDIQLAKDLEERGYEWLINP
ncbi:MAG: Fe-S cluster assembly ATPase SufC [Gammaproteobacteria bacterium]|nr:Fe-S cluster assembly ATPase SufC [Gammaproteobacteria bacterium]|tara:strand:- start:3392 stop:4144 length:753 start_codon:yes stop_codon:yes gene_type:complete